MYMFASFGIPEVDILYWMQPVYWYYVHNPWTYSDRSVDHANIKSLCGSLNSLIDGYEVNVFVPGDPPKILRDKRLGA